MCSWYMIDSGEIRYFLLVAQLISTKRNVHHVVSIFTYLFSIFATTYLSIR